MRHQPRILLATTRRWFSAARLALALAKAGFEVEAVCPSGHPLRLVSVLHDVYLFRGLRPLSSLEESMAKSAPDLIIPCDDLAAIYLRGLHKAACGEGSVKSRSYLDLIERSLGEASSYPFLNSRAKFIDTLCAAGVATPTTSSIADSAALLAWCAIHGFPAVLKADSTWSGQGVVVVADIEEAHRAFRRLQSPAGAMTVSTQACFERDFSLIGPWLRRTQRSVSIQSFVAGAESNIAVVCLKGEVLASVSAGVVHTWNKHGPSSILRVLPDGEMLRVAKVAAKTFRLSGLFGLDFIEDAQNGDALLIEINPRATQTCHLALGPEHDLASALFASLTGSEAVPVSSISRQEIALFPLAWQGGAAHPAREGAHHDIPWEEPALVLAGEREIRLAARTRWSKVWTMFQPFAVRAKDHSSGDH